MIYVLTHEYADKSSFHICEVTDNPILAQTWYNANDDNNVYEFDNLNSGALPWSDGAVGWKKGGDR